LILLIDNYDSFTYNLVDYFNQLGVEAKVVRNDASFDDIVIDDYTGIVLSPGPERPSKAGNLLGLVEIFLGQLPMLGICLGHQAIAEFLGAKLVKANRPMHGKISKIQVVHSDTYKALPREIIVVRYHSLIVEELPESLRKTATTVNNELMSYESDDELKAWGLQFHPEAYLTEYGLEILKNWVTFHNIT